MSAYLKELQAATRSMPGANDMATKRLRAAVEGVEREHKMLVGHALIGLRLAESVAEEADSSASAIELACRMGRDLKPYLSPQPEPTVREEFERLLREVDAMTESDPGEVAALRRRITAVLERVPK